VNSLLPSADKGTQNKLTDQNILEQIRAAERATDRHPTEGQKKAGNYRKGHVSINGFDMTFENPAGSYRSGTDANGKKWRVKMNHTYGYFNNTQGRDKDHVDFFLGKEPLSRSVFVVDQTDPHTGAFDEHKVMFGFGGIEEARAAYMSNYEAGWRGLGAITAVELEDFRRWLYADGRKVKPFAAYRQIQDAAHITEKGNKNGNFAPANSLTIEQMLEGTTPIDTPKHNFKNIDEARKWAKENITNEYKNARSGETIYIPKIAVDKYLSEKALKKSISLDAHLSTLKSMPQLIETSIMKERGTDHNKDVNIREIQRFYGSVNYEGNMHPVKITVKAYKNNTNKAYSYEVMDIENPAANGQGMHADGTLGNLTLSKSKEDYLPRTTDVSADKGTQNKSNEQDISEKYLQAKRQHLNFLLPLHKLLIVKP
jgi:hypothetical protein